MRRKVLASPIQFMGHVALLFGAALGLPSVASAGFGDLIAQLTSTNPTPEDRLGTSVTTEGGLVLIGATGEDSLAGLAFPFDAVGSAGSFAFAAGNTTDGDAFGMSVDIDPGLAGGLSLVGAPGADTNGADSGAAYIFDANTDSELLALLPTGGAPFDRFGASVALGTAAATPVALVAADRDDDLGAASGSLFVFDAGTGAQIRQINASDGAADDGFGHSISMGRGASAGLALVGSPGDDDNGFSSGSAYIYDVATGNELLKLTASDGSDFDAFGTSVAIDGNFALVGAFRDDAQGQSSGSAYLFDVTTGVELMKLTQFEGEAFDSFGISVALDAVSGLALIGATGDDDMGNNAGAAYLYNVNTGQELAKLRPDELAANDAFGATVSVDAGFGVVGAQFNDDNGLNTGAVFLFDTQINLLGRPGDYNGDGIIDAADFTVWRDNFPTASGATPATGDGNGDGVVNEADYQVWRDAFIIDGSGPIIPIPEPTGSTILALGLVLSSLRRKKVFQVA